MRRLVVLIPEGFFVDCFVYLLDRPSPCDLKESCRLVRSTRIKFRGREVSDEGIRKLIDRYRPEAVAIKILYGGEEFRGSEIYDRSLLGKLEKLIPQSPLHVPVAIKLIKLLERTVPTPEIRLHFDTAFFVDLPMQEQTYALDEEMPGLPEGSFGAVRRFGYHGLYHRAASGKIAEEHMNMRRILSICLEPVPEVVAIYDGKPIMVTSGSTPLEGLPGNTTCGEIDPGIILLIEEKKNMGPEMINEMLTRQSGLTAMAGERVTIDEIFAGGNKYEGTRNLLEYRILLSCGSAIGLMRGLDAIVFSGRYVEAAAKLSEWLIPKLVKPSIDTIKPLVFTMRNSVDRIIAEEYFGSKSVRMAG
ncbi:MAG: hypothetical protein ACLP05_00725 [Candidatus Kryptoniota bacterium]